MSFGKFQVGDPVWAKMKGYSPWPAVIENPPSDSKEPKNKKAHHYVFFFGSNNCAWILDEHIRPHSGSMLNTFNKKRNVSYQNAVDDFLNYLKAYKREKPTPPKGKKEKIVNRKSPEKRMVQVDKSAAKHAKQVSIRKKITKKSLGVGVHGEKSTGSASKYRRLEDYYREKASTHPSHSSCSEALNGRSGTGGVETSEYRGLEGCYRQSTSTQPSSCNEALEQRGIEDVKRGPDKFGFIGSVTVGKHVVKTLLENGHPVTVWNETASQCDEYVELGAERARSPADLIVECDVTFCCASSPVDSQAILFGSRGVLKGLEFAMRMGLGERGYVEMTAMDPNTSEGIGRAVTTKRGRYLEAPLCRALSSKDAEAGDLLILASGDKELFEKCRSFFSAIGRKAHFISRERGDAARMSLIRGMLCGTVCAALAEAMVLVDRLKLQKKDFYMCLEQGPLNCVSILERAHMMVTSTFQQVTALAHIQRDMDLSLSIASECTQHMPITAAANEVYKHGKLRNYSDEDMGAVYKVSDCGLLK